MFFESEPDQTADLADLLVHHQIPIAILNACQSGKQVGASETSLGSRLIQTGVQLVLAMGYSVTVSAAQLLMKTLYTRLFANDELAIAIRHARTELYPEQAEVRKAIEMAFRQHYDQLSYELYLLLQSKDPQERRVGQVRTGLEYENLVTALNLALTDQVSILKFYGALSAYVDRTQDQRRGLELGQVVLKRLEAYPPDKLAGPVGAEFVGVVDNIATRQFELKQYPEAQASYQKALNLHLKIRSFDEETSKKLSAGIYYNLGVVAQKQRQWSQAEQYYQQALQIDIEDQDRYAQASTYHQLGRVAEEQRKFQQARDYFLLALETFAASNDTYRAGIVWRSLARLWQTSGDTSLPATIASALDMPPAEVETLLRQVLENEAEGEQTT